MSNITININELRNESRKLLREWGILKLSYQNKLAPSQAHALIAVQAGASSISALSEQLILDVSTVSRMVDRLQQAGFLVCEQSADKRVKNLALTKAGQAEIARIDDFSNRLIEDAFAFATPEEQEKIKEGVTLYAKLLEKSRLFSSGIEIRTLRKDKRLRQAIADMVYTVQTKEFNVDVTPDVNEAIVQAEDYFYFKNKCNFWYAIDKENKIAGCIGLKAVNETSGELSKCFVAAAYRGKGLSNRLVTKLIKQAQRLGIENIYIGTVDYFTWAHKFYEKFGFRRIDQSELPKEFKRCPVDSVFFCGKVSELSI